MVDIHQLLDQELQGGRERGEAWRLTLMFPGILLLVMAGVVWKWGGGRGGGGRVGGRVGRRSDEAGGRKKKEMGGNNLLGREGGKEGGREGGKKEGDGLDRMPNRQEGGEGKKEERKEGRRTEDAWAAWMEAGREGGTWILALQYALSFGVELVGASILPPSLPLSSPLFPGDPQRASVIYLHLGGRGRDGTRSAGWREDGMVGRGDKYRREVSRRLDVGLCAEKGGRESGGERAG